MPAPEPRKPSQTPQDEPAKPEGTNPPPPPARPQTAPQEPRKDEDGKPVIAPITTATTAARVEADDDDGPAEPRPDETVPGGRYQVGDKIVNCNGEVLGDAPKPARRK